ncbi:MAG: FAD/NAD(P)-binding protein [Bacillota bacterium]|nr:FAD/NAD(P)-binding protein [Bacillota bacterium]MDW7683762.1 FAD/NAD(P)-binding protein [Bacillota bacterium]
MGCNTNPLLPKVGIVEEVRRETPDVKTFRVVSADGSDFFDYEPGQCAMVSLFPVGEALFSITSSPTRKGFLEFSIKEVGTVTRAMHEIEPGQKIGIRGPYGKGFPKEFMKGKDLLFIAGGIALAPLRSLINYCMDNRDDYGKIDIIYGSRSSNDLIQKVEIFENWPKVRDTDVHLTVDVASDDWDGNVGFVPAFLEQLDPSPEGKVTITCGPPIMIKFVLQSLEKMGYTPENIITTLEMKMKCGVGKCGRCNIGDKYVCKEGPVFSLAELQQMPPEF